MSNIKHSLGNIGYPKLKSKRKEEHYITICSFPAYQILGLVGRESSIKIISENKSYLCNLKSDRLILFKKSTRCVCCGVNGTIIKSQMTRYEDRPHFNLYSKNGILMTKDHIVPKSKGGKDNQDNYQTMCVLCNHKKCNRNITLEELRKEVGCSS